ncbi:hypothetical protein Tco_0618759 [Tanacetum coccineum]
MVKKVKKMEVVLKRRHVVLIDSEDEDAENSSKHGRNLQEEGLDEMVRSTMKEKSEEFETPTQGKTSGEADISPKGLEAAETLAKVLTQRTKTYTSKVKTGLRRKLDADEVSTVLEEKSQSKRTKKPIREEQASLVEIVRLQAQEEAKNARKAEQQRQDALIAKRVQDELELSETQKNRMAQVQEAAKEKGPTWLFDLDYLTDSMNYQPVRSEIKDNNMPGPKVINHQCRNIYKIYDAGDSEKRMNSAQDYFIEKPVDKEDRVFLDELERLERQEKDANDAVEALRKEFARETENLLLQAGAAKACSTNTVNTVSSTNTVNTVSTPVSTTSTYDGLSFSDPTNSDQDDSEIHALEDIYQNPTDGIFTNSSYNDEGAAANFTNLETVVNVSPIPTSRISSIHPSTLILGDPQSAVQTRSKVSKSLNSEQLLGFIDCRVCGIWKFESQNGFIEIRKDERGICGQRNKASTIWPHLFRVVLKHTVVVLYGVIVVSCAKLYFSLHYCTYCTKVAGKPVSISEASIRSDLLFDDADGIDSLPNQAIFDAIQLMGYEGDLTVSGGNQGGFRSSQGNTTLKGTDQKAQEASQTYYHTPQSVDEVRGIKSAKGELSVHKDLLFDEIPKDTLDYMETEDAQDVWRTRDVVNEENENADAEEPKVSTDGSKVSTDKEKDSTDRTDESTDDQTEGRRATQTIQTITSTMFGDDEKQLPDLGLLQLDHYVDLKPLLKIDPKDKGKKKIEEEDESETESEESCKRIGKQKKIRARLAEEEATNDALIRNYDDIKARIEADRLRAERLQEEEREQFTVEERAKFLHDTYCAQRRYS